MSIEKHPLNLPEYDYFVETVSVLALERTSSDLHGLMCGYLCAGAVTEGEAYIRQLLHHQKEEGAREALFLIFEVFSISQQQFSNFDFEFEMLLPKDDEPLVGRAKAFSEWCDGFMQGIAMAGIEVNHFYDEESQEAFQHLTEFSELDYESLDFSEEDEKAFMEVSEYARMAVIRLHEDLMQNERERGGLDQIH